MLYKRFRPIFFSSLLACLLLSPALSMASGLATAIKECNSGNVEKCESVADKYDEADSVKRDYKKAASFYKKACDLKSAFGCRLLGYYYEKGDGVRQSYQQARTLYLKSCDLNDGQGCNNIGYLMLNPKEKGIKRQVKAGLTYLTKACEKFEHGTACRAIGFAYYNGKGMKKDYAKAIKFYLRGCNELEDGSSCYNLGLAHEEGNGVKKSTAVSQNYYKMSCDLGDKDGCSEIKKK